MAVFSVRGNVVWCSADAGLGWRWDATRHAPQERGFHTLYRYQEYYWWLVGPPLILPVYFHIDNLMFLWHTKGLADLLWTGALRTFSLL